MPGGAARRGQGSTKNVAGVYVDDEAALLYVYENDFTSKPAVIPPVAVYRLSDGTPALGYPRGDG
jgi:hypothetical protein